MAEKRTTPRKPLNKTEAKKQDYAKWDDDPKKYKVRKRAKFNYNFIQIAARLIAAGHTESDIGYVLGVKKATVASWKQRYPQFKAACDNGKKMAQAYLVSQGLRAACGYDYEEQTFESRVVDVDKDGEDVKELVCIKKIQKHQKPDAHLLMFFLTNMAPKDFSHTKNIKVDQTNKTLNLELSGQIESDTIRKLSGKLLEAADKLDKKKKVESTIIDS